MRIGASRGAFVGPPRALASGRPARRACRARAAGGVVAHGDAHAGAIHFGEAADRRVRGHEAGGFDLEADGDEGTAKTAKKLPVKR